MPIGDAVILGFVIGAFVIFAVTLGWVSHADGAPRTKPHQPRHVKVPSALRHSH